MNHLSHSLKLAGFCLAFTALFSACQPHSSRYDRSAHWDYEKKYEPQLPVGETYAEFKENEFTTPQSVPYSTFAADVDDASYANIRRFLNNDQLPHKDIVRIEEMINYFSYDFPQPTENKPLSITTEVSSAPWNPDHKLVQIALQGKKIPTDNLPASNLVFLLDVSGSMNDADKLPLVKQAFSMLVEQLRPEDRVSIVVYAGASGLVLPPTPGDRKYDIMGAMDRLSAGGSTNGTAGMELAYEVAAENFIPGGNNRVILATDGDFNVGITSDKGLETYISKKRDKGIFLTVLGVGEGNYHDREMQTLAQAGNGNASYLDNVLQAEKVLVNEFGGTMFTIAKDVKIQVEFNPAFVQSYRLIGYETRALAAEDFNNDRKDAGEVGSGHTVTALYEIIPTEEWGGKALIDDTRYQNKAVATSPNIEFPNEVGAVKVRYKDPEAETSQLLTEIISKNAPNFGECSENFRFASAVAAFGLKLRDSKYQGQASFDQIIEMGRSSQGNDPNGYRAEFVSLVKKAKLLEQHSQYGMR